MIECPNDLLMAAIPPSQMIKRAERVQRNHTEAKDQQGDQARSIVACLIDESGCDRDRPNDSSGVRPATKKRLAPMPPCRPGLRVLHALSPSSSLSERTMPFDFLPHIGLPGGHLSLLKRRWGGE